ncbi:trypsin-like peptidase domain-containing protein [Micromonospora sp. WMMA1923]|uniref:trypsin-like peptidase domain-containing protein n=1 Tax=Micromonospora sp. WMMA1923 TaxID=3404125 RepID=UPI003B941230
MTEYESDPQRRPAPADAESSPHSAELPRVEHGHSDRAASAAGPPSPSYPPSGQPGANPGGPWQSGQHAGWARPEQSGAPGRPESTGPGQVASQSGYGQAGPVAPQSGAAGYGEASAAPQSGPAGYGQGGAASQSGPPSYGQSGPPGYGQPGTPGYGQPYGQSGPPGYGQPSGPPYGQPVPPWAQAPRAGRVAKFVGAGVLVFALMLGSGVAGGVLALALDGNTGITRTYSAAPVIDSADLPKIAASVQDSVVSIATDSGEGSGVILTADGFVLTNNHVVASGSAGSVRVIFADGKTADAQVVGTDPKTDLAVVKATGVSDLKAAKLGDSDAMQVGDQVLALGSPLGLQGSVTSGILSARDRTIQAGGQQQDPQQGVSSISGLLQTDAPINPGNSGGALVNTRGEVIGINTAIATSGQSTGNIGVGFAIPSNKAKDVAGKLQRGEKISHPSLGVSVTRGENGGAVVSSVLPGSAAEQAGLQRGDVITRFGDKTVNDSNDLVGAVQASKVGDRVEVRYQRGGNESTVTVTLTES